MSPLAEIEKARVFISSLNRYKLGKRTLSKTREDLVAEIQQRFPFLCVEINEQWQAAGAGEPREATERRARTCHLFVGILVDSYGYQDTTGLSATQIEFEAAMTDREKMLVFVQDKLRDPAVFAAQPESYQDLLDKAADVELMGTSIRGLRFLSAGVTADRFELEIDTAAGARKIPVVASLCPDRFSYTDAARYVGYPFRTGMEKWADDLGPLHLVCLYRTITDTQIRRHLGNPDIHVSREKWGFYALDPERFIQAVYLQNCQSPQGLLNRIRQFLAWLHEYGQAADLIHNAERRGRILRARA